MRAACRIVSVVALILLLAPLLPAASGAQPLLVDRPGTAEDVVSVSGLERSVRVRVDDQAIPHVFAQTEHDALYVLGYLHAQDRFFQMDTLRRTFSGTLAELVGDGALGSDVQLRTLGLRRAAERSLPAASASGVEWMEAYAAGVNDYLADTSIPLPPEYTALELTRSSIPVWTPVDSLVIAKGLAFGLSFDLSDIDRTVALLAFQTSGSQAGFDGAALFSEDTYRTAPFDDTVSIPDFLTFLGNSKALEAAPHLNERTLELAKSYRETASQVPMLKQALTPAYDRKGSNWWVASGAVTDSGLPIYANDPHLGLDTPSIFYEAQLRVAAGEDPALNAFGVTFPGIPSVVLGCNIRACWGATVNPMDVTDVYLEELVLDPGTGLPVATMFDGQPEPITIIPQTFRVNVLDGTPDTLVDAGLGPLDGGVTLVVPRRNNGPIVDIDLSDPANPMALSVQYTGWGATRELDAFRSFLRAYDEESFRDAVQFFDVGSQNFGYADVAGNIAYFTSAEMPLREDLQNLNAPDGGVPPFLIRDGSGGLQHEWIPLPLPPGTGTQSLPYAILPFDEMPQVVNPESGYIINANNDPVGTSLDNNPLNQLRPGGGLYYLSPGYASGFRAGRIQQVIEGHLASGDGMLSLEELRALQANNQLLDAEVLVPYITQAFGSSLEPDTSALLDGFGSDPEIVEAVGRLTGWDFSTPTGIPEGYDPGDDPANLPAPSQAEIDASVAATIYSAWRGQIVHRVIDDTLSTVGVEDFAPGSSTAVAALRHHLDTFATNQGIGASGLDFFAFDGAATREEARDLVILECLRSALDLLASDEFAPAFGNSTDQDAYRWGLLHRIVFEHILGGPFSIPPAGGFASLGEDLPGIARAGGFGAVDASSHSARANGLNEFMFGSGPARRFVGVMTPSGPVPQEVIPGGQVGIVGHPDYASQLPLWLTNAYHPFPYMPGDVVDGTAMFRLFLPQE